MQPPHRTYLRFAGSIRLRIELMLVDAPMMTDSVVFVVLLPASSSRLLLRSPCMPTQRRLPLRSAACGYAFPDASSATRVG